MREEAYFNCMSYIDDNFIIEAVEALSGYTKAKRKLKPITLAAIIAAVILLVSVCAVAANVIKGWQTDFVEGDHGWNIRFNSGFTKEELALIAPADSSKAKTFESIKDIEKTIKTDLISLDEEKFKATEVWAKNFGTLCWIRVEYDPNTSASEIYGSMKDKVSDILFTAFIRVTDKSTGHSEQHINGQTNLDYTSPVSGFETKISYGIGVSSSDTTYSSHILLVNNGISHQINVKFTDSACEEDVINITKSIVDCIK